MKRGVKRGSGPSRQASSAKSGSIRIISGQWRGRKLPVLNAEGLRPTTDRTKETLFNWLMQHVANSQCLDAFAGSGSLGMECLSRFAKSVTFYELSKQAATQLTSNLQLLKTSPSQAKVVQGDSLKLLSEETETFDLIFLDPPFHKNLLPGSIERIAQQNLLKDNGLIYIESELENSGYSTPDNWQLLKEKNTQQVSAKLFQRTS